MTPEAQVRSPTVKWARNHDIMHVRMSFRPGVAAGIPDDLFLHGGKIVFIEFKRPGKEPTPLQWAKIHALRKQGFTAEWFDNSAEAIQFLRQNLFGEGRS